MILEQVLDQQVMVAELFSAAATFKQVDLSIGRVERIDTGVKLSVDVVVAGSSTGRHCQLRDVSVMLDVVKLQVVFPELKRVAELATNSSPVQNFWLCAQHWMNAHPFLKIYL